MDGSGRATWLDLAARKVCVVVVIVSYISCINRQENNIKFMPDSSDRLHAFVEFHIGNICRFFMIGASSDVGV